MKRPPSRSEVRSADSILESEKPHKSEVKKKRLNVAKLSNRKKDILDKLEADIKNLRGELIEPEAQYLSLKNESVKTSQEALNDIDCSEQHREEHHELQRKAYELDIKRS